jgi:hypothetical protein
MAQNPTYFLVVLIIGLAILFLMSRLNNRMELRFQDRAILISRGLVGTLMWFLIGPTVGFIVINIIAVIFQVPTISIGWLWDWLGLTASNIWWLLKCGFGSSSISGQKEVYTVDSMIRIFTFVVPVMVIWWRMTKTRLARVMMIPFIVGIFFITRHKKADETFITQKIGVENLRKVPLIGGLFDPPTKGNKSQGSMTPAQRKVVASLLIIAIAGGFVLGLYFQYRAVGIALVVLGIFGFVMISPTPKSVSDPHPEDHPFYHNIDSLVQAMDSVYNLKGDCVEVYHLSLALDAAYHAQYETVEFPDTLCQRYRHYFYEWCQ